jgi:hypothetical protein
MPVETLPWADLPYKESYYVSEKIIVLQVLAIESDT